jgi:hypothetical protein
MAAPVRHRQRRSRSSCRDESEILTVDASPSPRSIWYCRKPERTPAFNRQRGAGQVREAFMHVDARGRWPWYPSAKRP